eukprot:TRINITY_DN12070_c0_g1_i2.p1 TRINITY_DN12070_c0_g1~~TRINITY_DN12070_c0_g1_i2.p1  ORF type:complete len:287 (-),score=60.64 TRINITY_DN12070_c0_g1_i2:48-908(-)
MEEIIFEVFPFRNDGELFNIDENGQTINSSGDRFEILTDGEGFHILTTPHELTTTNPNREQMFKDAAIKGIFGIARGRDGTVYVSNSDDHVVGKLSPDLQFTLLAGRKNEPGFSDGNGTQALFNTPRFIAVDSNDNIFASDNGNHVIRKVTPNGDVTTVVGIPQTHEGTSSIYYPNGICIDREDIVYFCDSGNGLIRRYDPHNHSLTTIAGNREREPSEVASSYALDLVMDFPFYLKCDPFGNLYTHDHHTTKLQPLRFSIENFHKLPNNKKARIWTFLLLSLIHI